MSSVNKVIIDRYASGESITDIASDTGIARSTLRFAFKRAGVLRSRADGVRNAAARGKMARTGPRGPWSSAVKERMREAAVRRWDGNSAGTTVKPSGYVEYTTGDSKGRSVHVVKMEQRIGRRLRADEVVHHIDGDRANNDVNNLALMTRSGHTRLHRREEKLAKGNGK